VSMATGVTGEYTNRLLTGLSTGLLGPPTAVYIAEATEQRYRGAVLAMISFSVSAGILAVHTMGTFLGWRLVLALCSVVPFAGHVLIWFTPESPVWLCEDEDRRHHRRTAAVCDRASGDVPSSRRHASASVGRRSWGRYPRSFSSNSSRVSTRWLSTR